MRKIATVVLCVFCATTVATGNRLPAADQADAKVDAFVRSELARQRIPGVKLRVYREGKLTRSKSWAGAEELGEVSTLELMERTEEGGQRNHRYRAGYSQRTLMLSIGLTKNDKIAKLDFSGE